MYIRLVTTCAITLTILVSSCHPFVSKPCDSVNVSNYGNTPFFADHEFNAHNANKIAEPHHGIKLASWKWNEVEPYFLIATFLLLAAIVKIIYHHLEPVHAHVPESCVLIVLGSLIGLIFHSADYGAHLPFNKQLFFMLLLPPIILESSYSLHDREFFFNLKSILLYAIIGTILNIILVGSSLYLVGQFNFVPNIPSFLELLTFSTIISAVDPVAVLAIFHEIGVNKSLYFLVFGESLLNDAVVITIYNVITTITNAGSINATDILLGIASFFTVSLGGVSIGILFGILTALMTRTTKRVQVVEPLIVIVLAYLSYICSELFHFSGIIGLICCGLVQSEYMIDNIAPHSLVTIKYFTKTCSSISDVIIFFYLGRVLVRDHVWNTSFVCFSTLFCIIYRFLSVFLLTLIANKFMQSIKRINFSEQLLMAYGGLRGAIAFSLAISLDKHNFKNSQLFITTTLFIILFTVFILGSTTKPAIKWLHVKLAPKSSNDNENEGDESEEMKYLMFTEITERTISTIMSGIEEIADCSSVHTFAQKFSRFNNSILKRFLTHDDGTGNYGHSFKRTYRKVADRIVRRSIDGTAPDVEIDMELDPLNDTHYRTPWTINNKRVSYVSSLGQEEIHSGAENEEMRVKPRKKVFRRSATLSTTYKHRFQQQKPPIITHSMSNIEPGIDVESMSDRNYNTVGAGADDVWLKFKRTSSHNRRVLSTLFNSSQYYHLPRRDVLLETSAMAVQRVIRQTSTPMRSRGLSISSNRRSRRRSRSLRGAEEPGSPPNTPTTPTAPVSLTVTHL